MLAKGIGGSGGRGWVVVACCGGFICLFVDSWEALSTSHLCLRYIILVCVAQAHTFLIIWTRAGFTPFIIPSRAYIYAQYGYAYAN